MKRLAVAVVVVLGLGAAPGASVVTAETTALADAAANSVRSDFNGDGFADLAIGVPGESVGEVSSGAVNVLYGAAVGVTGSGSQYLTETTAGGRVGNSSRALSVGDFNGDGFADLGVGVPFGDVDSKVNAGAVNVFYGDAAGFTGTGSQFLTQNTPGVGSSAEGSDFFGDALTTGDFNNDGFADLAVGVPGEDSNIFAVGAVNVLYGGAAGLTGPGSQYFTQNSPGVGDSSERRDHFGDALTAGDFNSDGFADLAVGVPDEGRGDIVSAGAINVLYGGAVGLTATGSQFLTQNTPGVGDNPEPFDRFGAALAAGDLDDDGFAELAVGVPAEKVGSVGYAGAVNVLFGGAAGLTGSGSQFFTQNTPGVPSTAEEGDRFGAALAVGDIDNDGFADLAVGVDGESVGSHLFAGAVNVLYGTPTGLTGAGSQYFTQDSPGVGSTAEQDDAFGRALAAGDFDNDSFADLAVGVPEESSSLDSVGAVNVLHGTPTGLTGTGSQYFTQNSPGVWSTSEEGDRFGYSLAASGP